MYSIPHAEIWSDLVLDDIAAQTNILSYGVVGINTTNATLRDGDTRRRMLHLEDLVTVLGADQRITEDDGMELTVHEASGYKTFAPVLHRGNAWRSKWLTDVRTGEEILDRYVPQLAAYTGLQLQETYISIVKGVFGTQTTPGCIASTHTTGDIATPVVFDADLVIDARAEANSDDSQSADDLQFLFVHPKVYADAAKRAIVTYAQVGEIGATAFRTGKVPIISNSILIESAAMCKPFTNSGGATVYPSYLMSRAALYLEYQRLLEVDRGTELLKNGKRQFIQYLTSYCASVNGLNWKSTDDNPERSGLEVVTNWEKPASVANSQIRLRRLISKLS